MKKNTENFIKSMLPKFFQSTQIMLFMLINLIILMAYPLNATTFNPPFYQLKKAHQTIYLLGTSHFARKEDQQYSDAVHQAIRRADIIMVELSPTELNNRDVMLPLLMCQENCLHQLLTEAQQKRMKELIGYQHLSIDPVLGVLMLSQKLAQQLALEAQYGTEGYWFNYLNKYRLYKPLVSLETLSDQIKLLKATPTKILLEDINNVLQFTDIHLGHMTTLYELWRIGDIDQLTVAAEAFSLATAMSSKQPQLHKAFRTQLLDERNKKMFNTITAHLPHHRNIFIMVGALHLKGNHGLLDLLIQSGFKLTPDHLAP